MNPEYANKKIIFFDGECSLCNAFVDKVVSLDTENKYSFASLQGNVAKTLLTTEQMQLGKSGEFTSIILWNKGEISSRSNAVLEVMSDLNGIYSSFKIFKIIPTFVRDFFYNLVSKYRYKIFGKTTCRIPTPQERAKFLN